MKAWLFRNFTAVFFCFLLLVLLLLFVFAEINRFHNRLEDGQAPFRSLALKEIQK